jgi:hypothetical protein
MYGLYEHLTGVGMEDTKLICLSVCFILCVYVKFWGYNVRASFLE